MAKDLGTKFTCHNCQTKFYDMKKPAPICPKCGADQREAPVKAERKRAPARVEADEEAPKEPELESEDEAEDEVVEEEEDA